jgi:hypothetical protein
LLLGLLGSAGGLGDLLSALSNVAGARGATGFGKLGTDDRPFAAARAAATSEVLVPVLSATRVGERTGAIESGSGEAEFDLGSESSGMIRALLTLSSSISTSRSTPDGPAMDSCRSGSSLLIVLCGPDCDCG